MYSICFRHLVFLSFVCVQISFYSEPLYCVPHFKEKAWNAISVIEFYDSKTDIEDLNLIIKDNSVTNIPVLTIR